MSGDGINTLHADCYPEQIYELLDEKKAHHPDQRRHALHFDEHYSISSSYHCSSWACNARISVNREISG